MKPGIRGRHWEKVAESFLRQRGLRTLRRNFHCRFGEIDIIMRDGPVLVFVEVRFRRSNVMGGSLASIDHRKMQRIGKTAAYFLSGHPRLATGPCRFDVVSIGNREEVHGEADIGWIKNAFQVSSG